MCELCHGQLLLFHCIDRVRAVRGWPLFYHRGCDHARCVPGVRTWQVLFCVGCLLCGHLCHLLCTKLLRGCGLHCLCVSMSTRPLLPLDQQHIAMPLRLLFHCFINDQHCNLHYVCGGILCIFTRHIHLYSMPLCQHEEHAWGGKCGGLPVFRHQLCKAGPAAVQLPPRL